MDTSFINRLPPELLVAITTFITNQSTIFRLATVCRCWHDVLTGTAVLWTSINCRSGSRTSILLQRSKSHPIDVIIDRDRFVPEAVSLVADHTHRMRTIDVNLSPRQLEDVRSLLNGLAPILETMRMQGQWEALDRFPPYSSFFQGQFPALRSLHLEGYPFDLARSVPMVTNGLTTLVLYDHRRHDLPDLLEYLEHCKKLEHLRIDLPDLQGTVPAPRIVSLPRLRELRLARLPLTTLHHLSFPPSANLNIPMRITNHTERYSLAAAWARDGLLRIFELRPIKGIQMVFHESSCTVGLSGSCLAFTEEAEAEPSSHGSFRSDCLDSFQLLPIATTEFLRFVQPPRYPFTGTFRPRSCAQLLLQMPELKQMILDISVAPFFVRTLEPIDGDVPCPKLQALIIIRRAGYKEGLWDSLRALSNRRKDHGCPLACGIGSHGLSDWRKITALKRIV